MWWWKCSGGGMVVIQGSPSAGKGGWGWVPAFARTTEIGDGRFANRPYGECGAGITCGGGNAAGEEWWLYKGLHPRETWGWVPASGDWGRAVREPPPRWHNIWWWKCSGGGMVVIQGVPASARTTEIGDGRFANHPYGRSGMGPRIRIRREDNGGGGRVRLGVTGLRPVEG